MLKSCSSIFGLSLISFVRTIFCFFLDSLIFFDCSNRNFPKSSILHTGGLASGDTSTRSSPLLSAISRAFVMSVIPSCAPSESISLTSLTLISSLILVCLLIFSPLYEFFFTYTNNLTKNQEFC